MKRVLVPYTAVPGIFHSSSIEFSERRRMRGVTDFTSRARMRLQPPRGELSKSAYFARMHDNERSTQKKQKTSAFRTNITSCA